MRAAPTARLQPGVDTGVLTVTGVVVDIPGSGYATAPASSIRDGTQFDPINPARRFTEATGDRDPGRSSRSSSTRFGVRLHVGAGPSTIR